MKNLMEQIKQAAFEDELQKIATLSKKEQKEFDELDKKLGTGALYDKQEELRDMNRHDQLFLKKLNKKSWNSKV